MKGFLRRLFNVKNLYMVQGMVYLDTSGETVVDSRMITDKVRFYDKMNIRAYSYGDAVDRGLEYLALKYPLIGDKFNII